MPRFHSSLLGIVALALAVQLGPGACTNGPGRLSTADAGDSGSTLDAGDSGNSGFDAGNDAGCYVDDGGWLPTVDGGCDGLTDAGQPGDAGPVSTPDGGCRGARDVDAGEVCELAPGCASPCPATWEDWNLGGERYVVSGSCTSGPYFFEMQGMDSTTCFYDGTTGTLIAGQYCTDTNAYCAGTSGCVVAGTLPAGTIYSYSYGATPGKDCTVDGGPLDAGG